MKGDEEVHPRILIVDDERMICESCQRILVEENHEVECVFSGQEAIDKRLLFVYRKYTPKGCQATLSAHSKVKHEEGGMKYDKHDEEMGHDRNEWPDDPMSRFSRVCQNDQLGRYGVGILVVRGDWNDHCSASACSGSDSFFLLHLDNFCDGVQRQEG